MADGSTIMTPSAESAPVAPQPQAAAPAVAPTPGPAIVPAVQPPVTQPAPDPSGYADFTLPEGVEKDEALLGAFKPLAKELGLKQEQAQKLVDLQAGHLKTLADAQVKAWDDTMQDWQKQAREDKEYGGVKFDEHITLATNVLKKYGTPELVKALEVTGMGNHPEMIRFAYRVAKASGEAPIVPASGGPAGEQDAAKILFPNMA